MTRIIYNANSCKSKEYRFPSNLRKIKSYCSFLLISMNNLKPVMKNPGSVQYKQSVLELYPQQPLYNTFMSTTVLWKVNTFNTLISNRYQIFFSLIFLKHYVNNKFLSIISPNPSLSAFFQSRSLFLVIFPVVWSKNSSLGQLALKLSSMSVRILPWRATRNIKEKITHFFFSSRLNK